VKRPGLVPMGAVQRLNVGGPFVIRLKIESPPW